MADINTNLNNAPYFDDYLQNKKFYRILFKPSTAVQARELSQLQTILQRQISRFGSHVFKEGSIVDGVNPTVLSQAHVVRVRNAFVNNNVVDLEEIYNSSNNIILTSQSSNVEAKIHFFKEGSQAKAPETKRFYVTYTNVDDTNTKTPVGSLSVVQNSNTITGTGTSFTNYEVGDYLTLFETPFKRKATFTAKIDNIANNISLTLNRKLSFSNTNITSNNFTIHRNLTKFGVLGTNGSPEILNVVERTVRNQQSNTVNTAATSNTFILDFTVANTETLSVSVNGLERKLGVDYTSNTSAVVFNYNLTNNDFLTIVEKLNTVKYSGLQTFKSDNIVTSERAVVASNMDGVVYHKGHFLNIDAGWVVVSDNLEGANNSVVAIDSNEDIVSFKSDNSLLDNSAGFNNEVAPGADRLKINPSLVSSNTQTLAENNAVAVLINFNDTGEVLSENRDPQYNILGQQLAKRKTDTSGSFTIKRFVTDTEAVAANNELIKVVTESGEGYVNGYKVETLSPLSQVIKRGINTLQREDFEMNLNYGNYIRVNEFNGSFAPYDRVTFVHNGANQGYAPASNSTFLTSLSSFTPASSNNVGTAYVKSVELESGTPGAYDAVYRIHLFGLKQSANDSIQNARTIVTNDTVKGGADIILNSANNAVIQSSETLPLGSFGEKAVRSYTDSIGNYDNLFTVRKFSSVTDTFNVNGTLVIDVDDEIDLSGNNNIGAYNTLEVNNLILTNVGSEISCSATGTTTASGNVVTHAAGLSGKIHIGDMVQIDSSNKTIVTKILSTTTFQTKDVLSDTTGTLKKVIPVGKNIPVDPDMITTDQVNNTINVTVPILDGGNFNSTTSIRATYEFNSSDYKPFSKNIRKNLYRRINTNTNAANTVGPWDLGVVDIHKITGIFSLGNNTDGSANDSFNDSDLESARNYVDGSYFEYDSGQRDHFYDYGSLKITNKGRSRNLVLANTTIVVRMDAFTVDNNDGEGYFTVDSYPTTTSPTANNTTIKFEEIPSYISSSNEKISLRDYLDHRPRFNNVDGVNLLTGVANTSTVNPVNTRDYNAAKGTGDSKNSGLVFKNDSEFVSDYKINTSKRADVYIGEQSTYTVSVANNGNSVPPEVDKSMRVAILEIPPFPSLTREESAAARNVYSSGRLKDIKTEFDVSDVTVKVDIKNIRRYTMRDIGVLDERISNLEYYTSLNALENSTFNKQFKNENGIERFKNGIFVEPFISHQFGAVNDNEYRVSIDKDNGYFRPNFSEVLIQGFDNDIVSGPIDQFGQRIMFNHTEEDLVKQDKATKVRPAAPLEMRYSGTLDLFPEYDVGVNSENVGRVIINPDEVPPVQEGTVTTFGNWRTVGTQGRRRRAVQERTITTTTTSVVQGEDVSIGNFITKVEVSPFIREMAIGFVASGLRPNTLHSLFFNRVNVNEHVEPGFITVPWTGLRDSGGSSLDAFRDTPILRENAGLDIANFSTTRRGDPIVTGPGGSASGVFFVPKDTFLQGDRNVLIADIEDLETEEDAIISSASKMFYSNRLGVESQELARRTFDVQVDVEQETQRRVLGPRPDPIAQTFYIRSDNLSDSEGVFVSSLDLFFRRKSTTNSIKVFICSTENGYPDTSNIYKATEVLLSPAQINTSDDGSIATNFKFRYPVFLKKNEQYAFVVRPNAGDPDYDVYFAELGGVDLITGSAVNSQPYEGVAFMGANQDTWSAIQDEDIKFTIKKASFSTGAGRVRFFPTTPDRGEIENINYVNNNNFIRVGDLVYGMTSASSDPTLTVSNVNTSITGVISNVDSINDKIDISISSGNFNTSSAKSFTTTLSNGNTKTETKYKLAIYRPNDSQAETENLNIDRFVGTTFMSIQDHEYSVIVPQFTTVVFKNSSIDYNHVYNISNTSSITFPISNEEEYEYTNNPLVLRSRTNEKLKLGSATGNTSFYLDVNMFNGTTKTSPFIDLRRTLYSAIGNLTKSPDDFANNFIDGYSVGDANTANIYTEIFPGLGETNVRYISQPVTLADGQDAEDLRVILSAFKPPRAKIDVFVRFANQYDNIEDALFTPLKNLNPELNSNRSDREDFKEFEYRMFTRNEINDTEWVKVFNDTTASDYAFKYTNKYTANSLMATDADTGIGEYYREGTTYKTFKQFQIKIVTYATVESPAGFGNVNSANPALIRDLRAVALQV